MPRDLAVFPKLAEWPRFLGYKSSTPKEEGDNYMAKGSENAMLTGSGKTQAFKGLKQMLGKLGGIVMMNIAEGFASLGKASEADGFGNVFNVYNCLFFIGSGWLRINGADMGCSAEPILSLLVKSGGSYTVPPTGPFQAGLAQPSAPTIRAITPPAYMTGKNNGVVSVVIWRIRSSTGAVSIMSEPSNIAAALNQSIAVKFPSVDANGQDYWGVGVTRNGEGASGGSHFELIEVPEEGDTPDVIPNDCVEDGVVIDGVLNDRTIVIEWSDGDLVGQPFAPYRDYPPPLGYYAGAIEDIVFVDGTFSDVTEPDDPVNALLGTAISPSEPGKPESFSPDNAIFTNDFPTGLIRGDGLYWRFGKNSCYLIRYLGGEHPLSVEIGWEGLGIEHQHNACIGEGGRLYLWPNERGPMQLSETGMPDGEFAADVADDFIDCTDPVKRVLGWDGKHQVVAFCYGRKIWPWFTALRRWGAPANVGEAMPSDAYIRSCVTERNILRISDSKDNLYEYNAGTGSVMKIRTSWAVSNGGMDNVAMILAAARVDNVSPITIKTFADGDDVNAASSIDLTPDRTGYQRLDSVWPNVIDCEAHAIEITIRSTTEKGDCGIESIITYGDAHSIVR